MKYHPNIFPFYLIQMLWGRAQLFLTDPRILVRPLDDYGASGEEWFAALFDKASEFRTWESTMF